MSRDDEPVRFEVREDGERVSGLAPGVDRAHLRRLESGDIETDSEIDLHGLDERNARFALRAALREAHSDGDRCVRVIHGRGRHSDLGAVLKPSLPGWLAEPPLGKLIMAFATAPRDEGGTGATRVLLRRRR